MKIIKYKTKGFTEVYNPKTESTEEREAFVEVFIECKTKAEYEANLLIAEKEAVPGTLDPDNEGEFDEEAQLTDAERIAELEEALAMLLNGSVE